MTIDHTYRQFTKMHGLGNDFVIFDARQQALDLNPNQVRTVSDRKRGVGCDQLITTLHQQAEFHMVAA